MKRWGGFGRPSVNRGSEAMGKMKASNMRAGRRVPMIGHLARMLLVAALLTGTVPLEAPAQTASANPQTEESVERLALQWFERMRMGDIDRAQLSAAYNAQLTDEAVQGMEI
jgi:hypothetical protein